MNSSAQSRTDRISMWAPTLLAVALLAVQLQLALRGNLRFFFDHHVNDDVFYYLQWAWNVAHGAGDTFDGIHRTNGVQPLWAWMLTALAGSGMDKIHLVNATLAVCAVLNATGLYLLAHTLRRILGPIALLVTLGAWTYVLFATQVLQSGMESSLNGLALILLVTALLRFSRTRSPINALLAGAAAGFAVLSRIDNLVYAGTAGLIVLLMSWSQRRWKHVLWFAVALMAIVGPYFLYNVVSFGHPMPISGRIKQYSHFLDEVSTHGGYLAPGYWALACLRMAETAWQILLQVVPDSLWWTMSHVLGTQAAMAVVIAALVGLIGLAWVVRVRETAVGSERRILGWLAVATIFHLGTIVFLVGKYTIYGRWYFIPQFLLICIGGGMLVQVLVQGLTRWARLAGRIATVVAAAAIVVWFARAGLLSVSLVHALDRPYNRGNFLQTRYDVAIWMKESLPEDAVCASFNAGQLGYFSDRRVVNLDGLVNNDELLAWHEEKKPLVEYLDAQGVQYVVDWEMAEATGRRTFHHIPLSCLQQLRTWRTPPEGPLERRFEPVLALLRDPAAAFHPFQRLGAPQRITADVAERAACLLLLGARVISPLFQHAGQHGIAQRRMPHEQRAMHHTPELLRIQSGQVEAAQLHQRERIQIRLRADPHRRRRVQLQSLPQFRFVQHVQPCGAEYVEHLERSRQRDLQFRTIDGFPRGTTSQGAQRRIQPELARRVRPLFLLDAASHGARSLRRKIVIMKIRDLFVWNQS